MFRFSPQALRRSLLGTAIAVCGSLGQHAGAAGFSTVYQFTGKADGAKPVAGVVLDSQGNMYGETELGGSECGAPGTDVTGCGTVFKIDPAGNETTLVTFNGSNGIYGANPLTLVGNRLYGGAYGPPTSAGELFAVNTDGSDFTILHLFDGVDGATPAGALQVMPNGDIYGVTTFGGTGWVSGGSDGGGVLFKLAADGTYTVLHNFDPLLIDNQAEPHQIIVAPNGTIYGTTIYYDAFHGGHEGGSIYSYVPSTGTYRTLHFFDYKVDGAFPELAGFSNKDGGTLVGATAYGGASSSDYGTLFKLNRSGLTTLYTFTAGGIGDVPNQPSLLPNGTIVGTAQGGQNSTGIIYSFFNNELTVLDNFPGADLDISTPSGPIAFTASGAIVGTAATNVVDNYPSEQCTLENGQPLGTTIGCGGVFSFSPH